MTANTLEWCSRKRAPDYEVLTVYSTFANGGQPLMWDGTSVDIVLFFLNVNVQKIND